MSINPEELRTLGNLALLQQPKTALFCSRNYPEAIERPTYKWALEQRYASKCILSGFHSKLEQAVFRYLLQGAEQPIVYVLARGIQPSLRFEYSTEIEAGRLLFLTPFEATVRITTEETAEIRNLLLADLADEFFIPYMTPGGKIDALLGHPLAQGKPIFTLDLPLNRPLLERGATPYQLAGVLGWQNEPPASPPFAPTS